MLTNVYADETLPQRIVQKFEEADISRKNELSTLIGTLSSFDVKLNDREQFTELFQMSVRSLELSEEHLANLLDTTRTTINRWVSGRNAPSRSARNSIFFALLKEAKRKLKRRDVAQAKVTA